MAIEVPGDIIENRTFNEIQIGDSAELTRTVAPADLHLFAAVSGDVNPAHLDHDYARSSPFGEVIAHGMFSGALISTLLGVHLPGPGTIYVGQTLRFRRPVRIGDRITASVVCRGKVQERRRVILDCKCVNQDGFTIAQGEAEVIAPVDRIRCRKPTTHPVLLGGDLYAIQT